MDCLCSESRADNDSHHLPEPPLKAESGQQNETLLSDTGIYKALCTSCPQIRLLNVLPGHSLDDILCELQAVSFDESPKNVALSYTWSDGLPPKHISVNGHRTEVTNSVDAALRQLRKPYDVINIWIDALCINQKDGVEKATQIGLMHSIYRRCERVYVWLGEEPTIPIFSLRLVDPLGATLEQLTGRRLRLGLDFPKARDDAEMFALVDHFAMNKHITEIPGFPRLVCGFVVPTYGRGTRKGWMMFARLAKILSTRWHSRLWCVQEKLLPENVTIMLGSFRLDFSKMKRAVQNWNRHSTGCCAVANIMSRQYTLAPDLMYIHKTEMLDDADKSVPDLDQLLRRFRYKDCQEPRDKVFGILATVNAGSYPPSLLRVDYSLSTSEVYLNAMTAILTASSFDLRHLTGSGFCSERPGLPSWARDLEIRPTMKQVTTEMERLEAYDLYNAAGSWTGVSSIERDRQLRVQGIYVDRIVQVCHEVETALDELSWIQAIKVLLRLRSVVKAHGGQSSLSRPDVRQEPFWRTVLADLICVDEHDSFARFRESDIDEYERYLRDMMKVRVSAQAHLVRAFTTAIHSTTRGRALFVTSGGHLGLGYPTMKSGDEVWVLAGGRVLFVLRPVSSQLDCGEEAQYRFIGDCYAYGFMDGEALRSSKASETIIQLV